jgi:alanyl-tRNA synthetase
MAPKETSLTKPTAEMVRRQFLDFFEEQGHRIVPSGPVFPQDDPTLLFTNAGMNQFKDVFLGSGSRPYTRAADTQKCIRVSGKHNDLEEVGVDTYHHTFFEMLGNWSFGDYFKEDAIRWAWQLLTEVWKLPKERLWVTVFGGDAADGLPADEEAERLWRECTDIAPERILRFDRRDNFWEMGETGPCGPCSEIHIDRGGPECDPADGADPAIGVNAGNERFIELWNLVFMQFNRQDDGSLKPLPAKHVDTGMGFERVLGVLQGVSSNYDTDLFQPIFTELGRLCGKTYGEDEAVDVAMRVAADHVRAVTAALSDGALPSNGGRGYVLRRLVRRAARFGRQVLGLERPFLCELVPTVARILGPAFEEMAARVEHVQRIVRAEEEAFATTLGRGLVRFDELADRLERDGTTRLDGAEGFELYATYGFPRDLVELMARERGLDLDSAGWDEAEAKHRDVSRSEGSFKQLLSAEQLEGLPATVSTYHDGSANVESPARVVRFHAVADGTGVVVLDRSPFYAESGGQVGDAGEIVAANGSFRFVVTDTQKLGDVVVHLGESEGQPSAGADVIARVDAQRRARTMRNHTATHLLHKALREVLGDHVSQQGSYVGPDRLRFDLSHPTGMTQEELDEVERRVNAQIYANATVDSREDTIDAAKAAGAMALFGEKYGDRVRMVGVGDWSLELCGGTHVRAAGDIGPFVLVGERALQAGVRRVEAVTGSTAVEVLQSQRRIVQAAARALKSSPEDVPERIDALRTQVKQAQKETAKLAAADVGSLVDEVRAALVDRGGFKVGVVDLATADRASLREVGTRIKGAEPDLAVVLTGRDQGKVPFVVQVQGAALASGLKAGDLAKILGAAIGGGGGGRPDSAQGQGEDASQLGGAATALRSALGVE